MPSPFFAPVTIALAAVVIALAVIATTVLAIAATLVPSWLVSPLSPSSLAEVFIITLVALTLVALDPLAFFVALVAVVFTTLAVAIRRCLLPAANARPMAARLSSTDAGATAASCPPAELLLPLMALYFIMADCYVVASAPAPSSHCCSHRHCCHRFVIVTTRPHLRGNPLRKKKRQKKSIFIYGTTFKKNESGSNFQRIQICNDSSQKKKNYGRHPLSKKCGEGKTKRPRASDTPGNLESHLASGHVDHDKAVIELGFLA
jgi:hypothetical protein